MTRFNRRNILKATAVSGSGLAALAYSPKPTLAASGWDSNPTSVSNSSGDLSSLSIAEGDLTFTLEWSNLSNSTVDFTLEVKLSSASSYDTVFTDSFSISGSNGTASQDKLDSSNFPVDLISSTSMSKNDFSSDINTSTTTVNLKVTFSAGETTTTEETQFDVDVTETADGPTNGLIAHYPFEGDATDETGNGYDGIVNGATYNGSGQVGSNSLSFDGTDDYVDTGISTLNTPLTFSLWFYSRDVSTQRGLISNFTGSGDADLYLDYGRDSTGQLRWVVDVSSDYIKESSVLQSDVWYHVVGTVSSSKISLYLNGNNLSEGAGVSDNTLIDSGHNWWIGWMNSTYHDGIIDDVRIYDRALSSTEVQNLYDATK